MPSHYLAHSITQGINENLRVTTAAYSLLATSDSLRETNILLCKILCCCCCCCPSPLPFIVLSLNEFCYTDHIPTHNFTRTQTPHSFASPLPFIVLSAPPPPAATQSVFVPEHNLSISYVWAGVFAYIVCWSASLPSILVQKVSLSKLCLPAYLCLSGRICLFCMCFTFVVRVYLFFRTACSQQLEMPKEVKSFKYKATK
jgi:hypothetical protein